MKLTKKQQKELDVLLWFADYPQVTDEDIKQYFDKTDKGITPTKHTKSLGALFGAKLIRDIQVKEWKNGWGESDNAWTFALDYQEEPQHVIEWIAKTLDRESIMQFWHEGRANFHRRQAYKYKKIIQNKPFNKPMVHRGSKWRT